eukprot:s2743_g12.t1
MVRHWEEFYATSGCGHFLKTLTGCPPPPEDQHLGYGAVLSRELLLVWRSCPGFPTKMMTNHAPAVRCEARAIAKSSPLHGPNWWSEELLYLVENQSSNDMGGSQAEMANGSDSTEPLPSKDGKIRRNETSKLRIQQDQFQKRFEAREEACRYWFQEAEKLKKLPRLREELKRGFAVDGVVLRCEGFSDHRDAWASIQDAVWQKCQAKVLCCSEAEKLAQQCVDFLQRVVEECGAAEKVRSKVVNQNPTEDYVVDELTQTSAAAAVPRVAVCGLDGSA